MYRTVDSLELGSFPTRRSSDLWEEAEDTPTDGGGSQTLGRYVCGPLGGGEGKPTRRAAKEAVGAMPRWATRFGKSIDRKSTRLNSSHLVISYAVFCLKKKKNQK